ncbi:MAG TPA: 4-hydroxy-tetrahydrodipicolinate reductase [Verrucomicrobiae bacterium]|nr:4-hydroxy-tetrahydrodipicolinate reductase [Verrucomicrobiae bacterium]
MTPIKIIVCGSKGRMGQALLACIKSDPELQLVGEIDQGDDLAKVIANADVVVDFSVHEGTAAVAKIAAEHKKALVIGTTGHDDGERKTVRDSTRTIPVIWSANFSAGVNTLFWLTEKVAQIVGNNWEAEVVETHHTAKKDAPSGTAKRLQEILKRVRGKDAPAHALRIGDVVGDHTVTFGTAGERLELTHRANSRETLARGALRAAKWAVTQKPGLYDMQDVLGLR